MLSGDEMFSDAYKIKLVDDVLYEVYGKVCLQMLFVKKKSKNIP